MLLNSMLWITIKLVDIEYLDIRVNKNKLYQNTIKIGRINEIDKIIGKNIKNLSIIEKSKVLVKLIKLKFN